MNVDDSNKIDININFDEKIKELEKILPKGEGDKNCAAWTFTSILDALGLENFFFNNLSIPLAGGFGGFQSMHGWKGPCGVVVGGCAAIGVIMGGQKPIKFGAKPRIYLRAAKFAHYFEKEFGSVICEDLCGVNFSDPSALQKYLDNNIWESTCHKFVIKGVDLVRKLTQKDLKRKWE
jgi:hypothetical protein